MALNENDNIIGIKWWFGCTVSYNYAPIVFSNKSSVPFFPHNVTFWPLQPKLTFSNFVEV